MDSLIADLRYGMRMLVRTPGLSAVAILTVALGVGLTTHTFSVVYGTVMRGLDFDRGTTLVSISQDIPSEGFRGRSIPILDLVDWREQQTAFRGLAAFTQGTVNLADEASRPERFQGAFVSANIFAQVDGVPILGRVFHPEEDAGTGEPMSVIFFDVEPSDPTVYAAIILTLGLAGFLACLIPARRATQIELVDALRPD